MSSCACKFNHKSLTVTPAGENLIITVDNACDICDKEPFNWRLCDCLPTSITAPLQVFITVNGVDVPVEDKYGNYVYSNQLKPRKIYYGFYGENPAHILSINACGF